MVFYIYKLKGVNYIGSTNNLVDRQRIHNKRCYKDKKDLKLYNHLRANNIKIEIILLAVYNRKCSNKIKKLVEQYWINKYDSNNNGLNVYRAFRSKKQKKEQQRLGQEKFRKNQKTKLLKIQKKYREKYKEKIKKNFRKNIKCELCGRVVRKYKLKRHKKSKICKIIYSNNINGKKQTKG